MAYIYFNKYCEFVLLLGLKQRIRQNQIGDSLQGGFFNGF